MPDILVDMVGVGEETGEIEGTLTTIAGYYLWQKILIPSVLFVLFAGLFVSSFLFQKKYKKDSLPISPICITFCCFLIEILVMVLFGTFMKGWAFGFKTYPMILICQIIVLFINIPLNTWLLILLMRVTGRFYKPEPQTI